MNTQSLSYNNNYLFILTCRNINSDQNNNKIKEYIFSIKSDESKIEVIYESFLQFLY